MVQEGRGHAAIDVWANGEAALVNLSFAGAEIALLRVQGYSMQEVARHGSGGMASTISRELRRNACNGGLAYRATTAQWHAERCSPPKAGEACAQRLVEPMSRNGWLASLWLRAGSCSRPGRVLEKPSARTTRPTRDGQTPGARSDRPRRLPVDFADDATMRISHEAIYQSAVRSRSRRVAPRTDLPAHRARVADAEARTRPGRGKAFISPRM